MTRVIYSICLLLLGASVTMPVSAGFDSDQPTVLITGANRGLGLEFARQYAAQGWNVIATARNLAGADELNDLIEANDNVVLDQLDVTSDEQVLALADKYSDQPIDVLLNNAAIYGDLQKQTLGTFDYEELKRVLDVNAIGVLRVSEAFLNNVLASDQKKIVNLGGGMATQTVGSLFPGHYFIKMSKAASMMSLGVLQRENMRNGLIVTMISPGIPDTQMRADSGWMGKTTPVDESAATVIERIALLNDDARGRVLSPEGETLPW